jgi:23S rRNA (pseudouridine1915-N3)-methyltransferase
MSITIIAVGKTKQSFISQGILEYQKRLRPYAEVNMIIVPDVKLTKTNTIEIVKEKEAVTLEKKLPKGDHICLLDESGKEYTSVGFANWLREISNQRSLTFVIGGVYGTAERIKQRADSVLRLSSMTFTHQMTRLFLYEQLYRAYTILQNKKYHY